MTLARVVVDVVLAVVVSLTIVRLLGLDRGFPLTAVMTVYPYVVLVGALAVVGAALVRAGLDDRLPHAEIRASRFTSGAGIWSRHPLQAREASRLRGFGATPRATVEVPDHGPLEIDAVHPLPPINAEWTRSWERVLAALPTPADDTGSRRLLAGDFNASIDHRRLRDLLDLGWVDAADARGAGLRPTFSGLGAGEPVPPVTLDHVLVDAAVGVEHVTTRAVPGSDHRMLIARLRLPAG